MKRIFGRSGREKEEEIQDVSLDILLAHKEDVITKVATKTSFIQNITDSRYKFFDNQTISAEKWVQSFPWEKNVDREGAGPGGEQGAGAEVRWETSEDFSDFVFQGTGACT